MTCPLTTFYAETEPVFPHQTGERKAPSVPSQALPVIDDNTPATATDCAWFWGVVACSLTAFAYLVFCAF